jgi:hypothetical protein
MIAAECIRTRDLLFIICAFVRVEADVFKDSDEASFVLIEKTNASSSNHQEPPMMIEEQISAENLTKGI